MIRPSRGDAPVAAHLFSLSSLYSLTTQAGATVSPFRTGVRVVLGIFIALLLAYVLVEQVGYWLRRRSGRDE